MWPCVGGQGYPFEKSGHDTSSIKPRALASRTNRKHPNIFVDSYAGYDTGIHSGDVASRLDYSCDRTATALSLSCKA